MKKTYRVTGEMPVHGKSKGETFKAELASHEEKHLIDAGAAEPVNEKKPAAKSGEKE